ncbi:FtsX-like permease family protein [Corynebacterium minutissimum]|uniref:ABC transporter permease n=1 Tax=Corynebacterium minutissimum TaxID=38301 RepID=A0A2X4UCZ3_9CORY|nr:FtsX-like permease family protein [Corynebacterium minutissimum]KHO28494.1 ABC transporter permease [Corynebacterium minutissimum]QPS60695.1 FtsX-like permease family protein [Corynebacterium minutissimum]QQA78518.1 FtsX-like permease family protein [Corynebacterium minutissimum]SQI00415.1 ABC transporter permease [Corynebacterium minutissimum]VEG05517.1 ABC transporter permease [Corynebacterium minutissimum]
MPAITAATRPTRRDLWRHPWRTIAAVILIALPVALVVGFSLFHQSTSLTTSLFSADRSIQVRQDQKDVTNADVPQLADDILPAGSTISPITTYDNTSILLGESSTNSWLAQFDAENPPEKIQEIVDKLGLGPSEIVLSRKSARDLDAKVGDTVSFLGRDIEGERQATVAAIGPDNADFVTAPALGDTPEHTSTSSHTTWVIDGTEPLTPKMQAQAAKKGLGLWGPELDRSLPTESDYPSGSEALEAIVFFVFFASIYIIAGLLILFLLAPVFTLAMGRNTRLYALMSSQGAMPRHIMLAVMAYGFFMGIIGATLGLAVGLSGGWIAWMVRYPDFPIRLPWAECIGAWLVAVVGSVIVSIVPAWLAQRSALAQAIQGGAPDRLLRFRPWMAIGPVVLPLLLLFSFTKMGESFPTLIVLFGVIAIAGSAPALVFLCSTVVRRGPLPLRLAGRGLTRRSMHALPTAIAIVAITFTTTVFGVSIMTANAKSRAEERTVMPETSALIQGGLYGEPVKESNEDERAAAEAATNTSPGSIHPYYVYPSQNASYWDQDGGEVYRLSTEFDFVCTQVDTTVPVERAVFIDSQGRRTDESPEAREECAHEMMTMFVYNPLTNDSRLIQADSTQLDLWHFDSEQDRQAAARTLDAGGIVLPHNSHVGEHTEGTVTVDTFKDFSATKKSGTTSATVPIAEALPTMARDIVLVSPQAGAALGMEPFYVGRAIAFNEVPDDKTRQELDDVATQASHSQYFLSWASTPVEDVRFYPALAMGLICLIVLALIIANASTSMRQENNVFQSIGAEPTLMSRVSAWQTWLVATASMLFGVLTGHIGAYVFADNPRYLFDPPPYALRGQDYFVPDWWSLLAVLVVPLVAAALAAAVNRTREGAALTARDRSESRSLT